MYLMIENPGEAPVEGFTTLGVSTTRFAGTDGTIGQFGTGSKHAVGVLLRAGIQPTVFCGKRQLEFFSVPKVIGDGLAEHEYGAVHVRVDGEVKELGFVLEHGTHDWTDVSMAMREFVSNAIDRSIRETGGVKKAKIELVPGEHVEARRGHTRIFIPAEPDVIRFFGELHQRFLHFKSSPEPRVMPRTGKSLDGTDSAMVYRNGVYARTVEHHKPALFNYNCGDGLQIDECRNVDDYKARAAATQLLATTEDRAILGRMFRALIENEQCWECGFESFHLTRHLCWDKESPANIRHSKIWQEAWKSVAPPNAAIVKSALLVDLVVRRGYTPIAVPDSWYTALRDHGIDTEKDVLNGAEADGNVESPATPAVIACRDEWWAVLKEMDLTKDKHRPNAKCFTSIMESGSQCFGYYRFNTDYIAIHEDIASAASPMLSKAVLEELAHYITGSTDNSRDFQDFAFRVSAALLERHGVAA